MLSLTPYILLAVLSLVSCVRKDVPSVDREDLFRLSIGKMEDQVDLFRLEGRSRPKKTRIAMRDGIVYLSDGNGSKIARYTSYGDLLSMIYDPETNPPPLTLKTDFAETDVVTRRALAYPLSEVGEIAVNSRKDVYVEDRLPPERRTFDSERRVMLDEVVLRFDSDGRFIEYLGQEGIGGTPFPMITGLHVTDDDELAVVTRHSLGWNVYWFDDDGNLLYMVLIEREDLPGKEGRKSKPSLERIVPAVDGRKLYLKIDYYKETVDESTNTRAGIGYDGSLLWTMDVGTGTYESSQEIPTLEGYETDGDKRVESERIYSFLGAARNGKFFFYSPDTGGYALLVLTAGSDERKRGFIQVEDDELVFNAFFLSEDGILSALLASEFEAKLVWWRTDRMIGDPRA
jgi:hypothetical protein